MAGLYFYVPKDKIKDIIECGIKLSEWFDREIELPGTVGARKAMPALIHPRDDGAKSKSKDFKCIRLEVNPDYCRVGDAALYQIGLHNQTVMQKYLETVVPLSSYKFGTFRSPECLLFTSTLPERIEEIGKALDSPILFESSEWLYLKNTMERYEQELNDSGNTMLFAYCCFLEGKGRLERISDQETGMTIFSDRDQGDYVILKTP